MTHPLSANILRLRKEHKLTQEELGRLTGVSAQAVSKWESGGMPDPSLLPAIADALHVTIDSLYGRGDVQVTPIFEQIIQELHTTPKALRLKQAYEYCWAMQQGMMGMLPDRIIQQPGVLDWETSEMVPDCHSQMVLEEGLTQMRLTVDQQYFLLMPRSQRILTELLSAEEYSRFFAMLGRPHRMDILFLLHSEDWQVRFTVSFLAKKADLPQDSVQEIIDDFLEWKLLHMETVHTSPDSALKVYQLERNYSLLPFLQFAKEMIRTPDIFVMQWYDEPLRSPLS